MTNNVIYFNDYTPGVKAYTPEMGDRKPSVRMEARLSHYGKHYFVDTTEELRGRGIEYRSNYAAADLTTSGQYKAGWHSYIVTARAFALLEAKYAIGYEMLLD